VSAPPRTSSKISTRPTITNTSHNHKSANPISLHHTLSEWFTHPLIFSFTKLPLIKKGTSHRQSSLKHKTDHLRSISLLAPRHPSAQFKVTVQCPLFYTHRMRYSIVGLEYTPIISACQYQKCALERCRDILGWLRSHNNMQLLPFRIHI
jgi:hypothetical protein